MMDRPTWRNDETFVRHPCESRSTNEIPLYRNNSLQSCSEEDYNEKIIADSHETMASATTLSCERSSSSADIFRLEFAATQWSKLVTNAEDLFNRLMNNNALPHNEQDQIEHWLCLKQEYEECIASDETNMSFRAYRENNTRRSLERIEEVTETDDSGESKIVDKLCENSISTSVATSEMSEDEDDEEEYDDDDEDEDEREEEDFIEKLEDFMNKFKTQTDLAIESNNPNETNFSSIPIITRIINSNNFSNNNINNNNNNNNNNDYVPIIRPVPIRNSTYRRNSMLPDSLMCNEIVTFTGNLGKFGNGNDKIIGQVRDGGMISLEEDKGSQDDAELFSKETAKLVTRELEKLPKNPESSSSEANSHRSGARCNRDTRKRQISRKERNKSVTPEIYEKEALRHEIRDLRRTREFLIEEKCSIDDRSSRVSPATIVDERKLLLCGEAIEAIDAIIEHKNVMMCERGDYSDDERTRRRKVDGMSRQLEKLSDVEIRALFEKYFRKVIDLKRSSRRLDVRNADLEARLESVRRFKREVEKKEPGNVEPRREHSGERLKPVLGKLRDDGGGRCREERKERNVELARLRRENRTLGGRLADVEARLEPAITTRITRTAATAARAEARTMTTGNSVTNPPRIVQQELKKIAPKTKVTRERNKLIIQQTIVKRAVYVEWGQ